MQYKVYNSFFKRMIGLLREKDPHFGYIAFFPNVSIVHTFGMRIPIDVVSLDKNSQVLNIETLTPFKFSTFFKGTKSILELSAGKANALGWERGDKITLPET